MNNKMAVQMEEQRSLRCHWLAEKNELEGRCFQLQGLVTQYQGTIRKKDKDYDKLQLQMAKIVKDSQRGQKAVITISKPLPKYENAKPPATLKDLEVTQAQSAIRSLEVRGSRHRYAS